MKILALLLFLTVYQVSAISIYSQNNKITVNMKDATVREVISDIENKAQISFFYNDNLLELQKRININAKNKPVSEILDDALGQVNMTYEEIKENFVVLIPVKEGKALQPGEVTGTVTDENGNPVTGATVLLKGTNNGTITDTQGKYSLSNVPEDGILIFSFMGMLTQEIPVEGKTTIDVSMKIDAIGIDEVVAIGYGTKRKVNLTGAVSTIEAEEIENLPVSNLTTALSGRMPGVNVYQTTGRPGVASSITIRAQGTWNNTSPLFVIDGVIRDKFAFDGLDVNEIENFSVLKDGASAAIYGSRAANGVILVTTKKGSMGKPTISYSGSVGISDATSFPEFMSAYEAGLAINEYRRVRNTPENDPRYISPDELEHWKSNEYNWLEEAWRLPVVQKHSLNVRGGNESIRYYIGGNYFYETGSFDKFDYTRYNFRGNIDANVTKDLVASLYLDIGTRNDNKPFWRWDGDSDDVHDLYRGLLTRGRTLPPYIDGKPVGNNVAWHPQALINSGGYNKKTYTTDNVILSLEYNFPFVQGLSAKIMGNVNRYNYFTKQFNQPYPLYVFKSSGTNGHLIDPSHEVDYVKIRSDGNWMYEEFNKNTAYQLNAFINYSNRFDAHSIDVVLVAEQSESFGDWFYGRREEFISPAIDQLDAANGDPENSTLSGSANETARISYVGRANYSYARKYLLEVSLRYDGSVNFAPVKRWGLFPAVSAGWRISEESFFKNSVNFIDNLKLRASAGLLGNDAVGGWQWSRRYYLTTGAYFGGLTNGVTPLGLPNPNITWEKSASYNMGLDMGFLNNRLTLLAEGYYRHTYDILGSRIGSIPSTFGANLPDENYATIDTKGFEVQLGYRNVIGDFSYRVSGNLGYAVNKIINIDEPENIRPYESEIGRSTDAMMGYIATDIIRTQADLDALPEGYTIFGRQPELGRLNYKDLRGPNSDEPDGRIDSNDQDWIINHSRPPVNYGIDLGVEWKGLGVDILLQGVTGHDKMVGGFAREYWAELTAVYLGIWADHWTPENTDATMPGLINNYIPQNSTFWKRDGSFLRLKNISLSYTLPKSVTDKLKVTNLRVYLIGTNLGLLQDKFELWDPELPTLDAYPIMKNYSFGINLSF